MVVVLGPYPLCDQCQETSGGLVAVGHRQIHLRAHGKEACVDEGLVGLIDRLWTVCDTTSCCEDDNGRAYVIPTPETVGAAQEMFTTLGIAYENEDGALFFRLAAPLPPPGAKAPAQPSPAEPTEAVMDQPEAPAAAPDAEAPDYDFERPEEFVKPGEFTKPGSYGVGGPQEDNPLLD
jgi:hypothetical protein